MTAFDINATHYLESWSSEMTKQHHSGWMRSGQYLVIWLTLLLACGSCARVTSKPNGESSKSDSSEQQAGVVFASTSVQQQLPLGLPEYYISPDNPMTQEKVDLGRKLFFDKILSVDHTMSCATCHDPKQGWSNGTQFAIGVNGHAGSRNVPSILNTAYYRSLFWDGRAGSLERQALGPILNPDEMGMPSRAALVERLQQHDTYPDLFRKAFSNGLTASNVGRALAAYERTIVAGNSPYDRFVAGDEDALSASAKRGMELFLNKRKSKCVICHEPPTFTALFYHNLGVGMDQQDPDLGRYEVTKLESNKGMFKVPTVRDVKDTAPYMHDGSIKTLEEVIELYDKGGIQNPYLSREMYGKLNLTKQEKADLLAFMVEGLSSDDQPTP